MGTDVREIDVRNAFGSVFVRSGPADRIDVHAVVQCLDPSAGAAHLRSRTQGERLIVDALFDTRVPSAGWDTARGRVDLSLWIPPDRRLHLRTTTGNIEVRGMRNGVVATTSTGNVSVAARGAMVLTSRDGAIVAAQRDSTRLHDISARTEGDISATIQNGLPVDLDASACAGTIDSDLSDARREPGRAGCERVRVQRGDGARARIRLDSGNGRIVLRSKDIVPD